MRKIPIQRRKLYNTAVNILSVENLSKTLRDEPLFENATFGLDEGGKAGIVGRNGAGKSTLLKVIAGYTVPDEGTVSARNGLNTVYLGQQVEFGPDATVRSFLYESDSPLIRTIREYEEAVEAGHESTHLLERIQDGDLWGIERSYYGYLGSLGADIGPERTMASLSGGEAKKAAVARALALRPEIESGKLSIEAAELNIKVARAGYIPSISLTAGIGSSNANGNDFTFSEQIKQNWNNSMGITLSIPLFDRRQTKSAVNKAKLQKQTSQLDLMDQQKELYRTIESYWLDASSAQQQYAAATLQVESAQASYDLVSEQFNAGMKNTVDLLTEKNNLLNAQQAQLQAKYMALLNAGLLRFYQGEAFTLNR